jgi:hypothetical protein
MDAARRTTQRVLRRMAAKYGDIETPRVTRSVARHRELVSRTSHEDDWFAYRQYSPTDSARV